GLLGFWPAYVDDDNGVSRLNVGAFLEKKITANVGGSFDPPKLVWKRPAVWFGTDIGGHSVFWEVVYGTRLALTVGVIASLISIIIGTFLGTIAGYFGGWVDALVIWLFSTFSSVPWILLAIAIATALETYEDLN